MIMTTIKEDKHDSPISSDEHRVSIDINREEMLWSAHQEMYIKKIKVDCKFRARGHKLTYKKQRRLYNILSIPPIIVPIIMSGLTNYTNTIFLFNSFCFIIIGVFSALNSFLDYGRQSQENIDFESKYLSLVSDINLEFSKPKKFRVPVDVFLERTTIVYNQLNKEEPLSISISKIQEDYNTPLPKERHIQKT